MKDLNSKSQAIRDAAVLMETAEILKSLKILIDDRHCQGAEYIFSTAGPNNERNGLLIRLPRWDNQRNRQFLGEADRRSLQSALNLHLQACLKPLIERYQGEAQRLLNDQGSIEPMHIDGDEQDPQTDHPMGEFVAKPERSNLGTVGPSALVGHPNTILKHPRGVHS